jgi:hypothetical protein
MQPNASREILIPVEPMLMYSIASPVLVVRIALPQQPPEFYNVRTLSVRSAPRMRPCGSIGYNAAL